jgi:hypothetical protein
MDQNGIFNLNLPYLLHVDDFAGMVKTKIKGYCLKGIAIFKCGNPIDNNMDVYEISLPCYSHTVFSFLLILIEARKSTLVISGSTVLQTETSYMSLAILSKTISHFVLNLWFLSCSLINNQNYFQFCISSLF